VCERVIGTIRRECLDWLIPLSEAHLRTTLRSWVKHTTIAEGRTWDWVRELPILRSRRLPDRLRAIVAENPTWRVSTQSSEDCITSTHWRPRDPLSGDDSNFRRSQELPAHPNAICCSSPLTLRKRRPHGSAHRAYSRERWLARSAGTTRLVALKHHDPPSYRSVR
jgi:hypothetical protein